MKPNSNFIKEPEFYKRDLDIIGNANKQTAQYLHLQTGKPLDECIAFVENNIKVGGKWDITPKKLKCTFRKPEGDRTLTHLDIDRIIKGVERGDSILSPNLVVYDNPNKNRSFIGKFIDDEMARRGKIKKMGFVAKQNGDSALATYCSNEEAGIKVGINGISGAHLSPHNPLYNRTGHSTLTSTCRVITSYSNASTERMLSGNRHYWSYEITRNNILTLSIYHDREKMKEVIEKYNLHIPTVEDLIKVISRSTSLYWRDAGKEKELISFLNTMDDIQRAAIAYIGDFYHLRIFNNDFIRDFLSKLIQRPTELVDNPDDYVKSASSDMIALMCFLCIDFLKGKVIDDGKGGGIKYDDPDSYRIYASTIKHVTETFSQYQDIIDTFWITDNLPPSIYQLPSCLRRSVVGSDTDSTMFTTQEWVKWYYGKIRFHDDALRLANVVGFINIQSSAHWFAMVSKYMGVEEKNLYRLEMKNEFYFPIYMRANRSKHYLTLISAREGNVYSEPEIEVKGVSLKDSKVAPQIMKMLSSDSERCMLDIMEDKGIDIHYWEYRVAQMEHQILNSIRKGETRFLASSSIKEKESYVNEGHHNYIQHLFWQDVMKDKYGDTEPLPYAVFKVPSKTQNKTSHKAWIDSLPEDIRVKANDFIERHGKKYFGQFLVPKSTIGGSLPPEYMGALDERRVVSELMRGYYILLEMMGRYYLNKDYSRLLSDEIPFNPEYQIWE